MLYITNDKPEPEAVGRSQEKAPGTQPAAPQIYRNYKRSYQGAKTSDLTADWLAGTSSANTELYQSIPKLLARARQLDRDNPHARKFITNKAVKVVGANGIRLQMRIKFPNGDPDEFANELIEKTWKKWGKIGNCTTDGMLSLVALQAQVEKTFDGRDGEVFVRFFPAQEKIKVYEGDYVDITYNATLRNGNKISMGIEFDRNERPVAYYMRTAHPGDMYASGVNRYRYLRIPAKEMLHIFIQHRPGQTRGEPPMAPGMYALHMNQKYTEAEVIAARHHANMAVFVKNGADNMRYDEKDAEGNKIAETTPGEWVYGYTGQEAQLLEPTHPNQNYSAFKKEMIRDFGSSVSEPYEGLANDRENVNFSSERGGRVDAIDSYKVSQQTLIEQLLQPLFEWWLKLKLLSDLSILTFTRYDEYVEAASWLPRGYDWVDPKKDAEADILLVENNLTSKQAIVSKRTGEDYADILKQRMKELKAEIELEKLKLELNALKNGGEANAGTQE